MARTKKPPPEWFTALSMPQDLRDRLWRSFTLTQDGYYGRHGGRTRFAAPKSVPPARVEDEWAERKRIIDSREMNLPTPGVPPAPLLAGQFRVELDIHLAFIPPMSEGGPGFLMTRCFGLPFAPRPGTRIQGPDWEPCPDPRGLELLEVAWDIGRNAFIATSRAGHVFPIAMIPSILSEWLLRGWRFGSYRDDPEQSDRASSPGRYADAACRLCETLDDAEYESLHSRTPAERPTAFNVFWRALIRCMAAETDGVDESVDEAVAYAMDKTGVYDNGPEHQNARHEYEQLKSDERLAWRDKIARYPHVGRVVLRPSTPAANP